MSSRPSSREAGRRGGDLATTPGHFGGRQVLALFIFLTSCCALGCTHTPARSTGVVTLGLVDRGYFDYEFREMRDRLYREFTAQTGIRVRLLPCPESAVEQLMLWQRLLGSGPGSPQVPPDVFSVDVIWPGILEKDLIDLKPLVAGDEAQHFPGLVANMTVGGRMVALPSRMDIGLMYYRTDLLQRYGYRAPPQTWGELESMAARIQRGERARGNAGFWGYVWEGAISESLTCNALEWQASEGGGLIIDADGRVTVNNAKAIRAWERAARWVGSISPPGVTTYKESDAMNLWLSGEAAFLRHWTVGYVMSRSDNSAVKASFGVSLLPRGEAGRAEVFGGDGYAVSRHSTHPREAVALARFLCSRKAEAMEAHDLSTPPTIPALYADPELLAANPQFQPVKDVVLEGMIARPSTVTGEKYAEISAAYATAVHSVLVNQVTGAVAARRLEKQLQETPGVIPPRQVAMILPNPGIHDAPCREFPLPRGGFTRRCGLGAAHETN